MVNVERMNLVNGLAAQAKNDASAVPRLWELVERLIQAVCSRYCRQDGGNRLYELDDLCQGAYFAFLRAIEKYDPERSAFSTILIFCVCNSCRKEIGLRGKRDALFGAGSLDAPISGDGDYELTYFDILPDPDAEEDVDGIINRTYNDQLHDALEKCLSSLPELHSQTLRKRYYENLSLTRIGEQRGCNREAVRQIEQRALHRIREERESNGLEAFLTEQIDWYTGVGPRSFRTIRASPVELIVLKRENLALKWLNAKHGKRKVEGR